eukprot:14319663-Heterocapsa_arctica.AAC.1
MSMLGLALWPRPLVSARISGAMKFSVPPLTFALRVAVRVSPKSSNFEKGSPSRTSTITLLAFRSACTMMGFRECR